MTEGLDYPVLCSKYCYPYLYSYYVCALSDDGDTSIADLFAVECSSNSDGVLFGTFLDPTTSAFDNESAEACDILAEPNQCSRSCVTTGLVS